MTHFPLPMVAGLSPNPCGDCTACCTVLSVKELDKSPHSPCDHLAGSGCGRYESRPGSCRNWSCLWLLGYILGEQQHRPDLLGLILDVVVFSNATFIVAYEVWAGARTEPTASQLLDLIAANSKVCVISPARAMTYWKIEQRTAGLFG
jgi:hypothetical protein